MELFIQFVSSKEETNNAGTSLRGTFNFFERMYTHNPQHMNVI